MKEGDRLFLNMARANLDVSCFPQPASKLEIEKCCLQEAVFPSAQTVNVARGTKGYLQVDSTFNHVGEGLTVKVSLTCISSPDL